MVLVQQAKKFLSHMKGVKRKNLAAKFYVVPGFITVFKISVI